MAVPKRKTSRHRRGIRRSHHALGVPGLRPCPNCGAKGISHRVCRECGFYKGIQIIQVIKKVSRKKQRKKEVEVEVEGEGKGAPETESKPS